MMKFYIETYGCQMNKAESSSLIEDMKSRGFSITDDIDDTDIIIVNTCSVRKTAENRVFGRLGLFKKKKQSKKNLIILVMGCMAQRVGEQLINSHYGIDIVVGNYHKEKIPDLIFNHRRSENVSYIDEANVVFTDPTPDITNPLKSYLNISHGCNNFCSYCIVPYLRGREVSKSSKDIIDNINTLTKNGVVHVTLLGQNVNSYGLDRDDEIDFPDLLEKICNETDIKWVKFLSSHPKDLSDKLIETMANQDKVSKWIHLALQSGSDKILTAMNRKYLSSDYKRLVDKLRAKMPDIIITTDIIVGFSGETEDDFNDTFDIVKYVGFDDAFIYKYNERDNTLAHKSMSDDVSNEVKTDRISRLIDLQRKIAVQKRNKMKGRIFELIPERFSDDGTNRLIGISKEELIFVFDGDKDDFGKIVTVEAVGVSGSTLVGRKI